MIIKNSRARFEYEILDTFIAGMILEGWEVKSLRAGSANLKSAWVSLKTGEAFLENMSISPYKFSSEPQELLRSRKLLLKKNELAKISRKINEKGVTLIPLKIFADKNHLKCEIAIGRGRKTYQKKEYIRQREDKKMIKKFL